MTYYSRSADVESIADELIRDVEMHKKLADVRIEYLWRDTAAKSKGRTVLAKARKVGGLNAYLANSSTGLVDHEANEDLFVVEVAFDTWQALTPDQRIALVDHELCHLKVDDENPDEPKLSIRGHDLEEFGCIVERHGLWASDVARFGSQVAEQLALAVEQVSTFLEGIDPGSDEPS